MPSDRPLRAEDDVWRLGLAVRQDHHSPPYDTYDVTEDYDRITAHQAPNEQDEKWTP